MIRRAVPFVAAAAALALLIGPGQQLLPAGLRLQSNGSLVASQPPAAHVESRGSGIGLAPAPVVNPPATAARLSIAVSALEQAERGYSLQAKVLAPDGRALADAPVRFYELVDLFGAREMHIGNGTTDGRGVTTLGYLPARTGPHHIVVRTTTQGKVTAGEGRTTFDATVAASEPRFERSALAAFSDRVPYAVGVLVLAVWGLIALALFGTARGVIGGARGTSRKGDTA